LNRLFVLTSKDDCVVKDDDGWRRWYEQSLKCSHCGWPGREWMANPTPIDCVVAEMPRGSVASAGGADLVSIPLWNSLRPYFPDCLLGECRVAGSSTASGYMTWCVAPTKALDAHRGPNCRHEMCPGCGRIRNMMAWARGAVVERYIDQRRVYEDLSGRAYIDPALAEELDLKGRFPDLKLIPYEVIPEPLDQDILPGDPGWDGTFRPNPPRPQARGTKFRASDWTA